VTGTPGTNALNYTGREDDGTGLKYYRARYYHAGLARFISEDPIGFQGGDTNLYAYVRNGPIVSTDPMGLFVVPAARLTLGLLELLSGRKSADQNAHPVVLAAAPVAIPLWVFIVAPIGAIIVDALGRMPLPDISFSKDSGGNAEAKRAENIKKGIPESALGSSGKPKIHNVEHSTRKEAFEDAQQDGGGAPMNHPHPAVGKPHYHPTDGAGEKIPGVHHNYPRNR
jgi:RHS repeat-associated protein